MTNVTPALIPPSIITQQTIAVIDGVHKKYLAALERQGLIAPRTVEPLKPCGHLVAENFRLRTDKPPIALVGTFGLAAPPEMNQRRKLDLTWILAIEVSVEGRDRSDTLLRRDWYAMVVAACVLGHLPRAADPIDAINLTDIDLAVGAEERTQSNYGEARLLFEVVVRDSIDLGGLVDVVQSPDDPYQPPVPWPHISTATTTTIKEPLQ